jgi:Fe-S cluster assembly protein SufD
MSIAAARKSVSGPAIESFEAAWAAQGKEPVSDWLSQFRSSGKKIFSESGFPSPGEESWKYTSLRKLQRRTFLHGAPCAAPEPGELEQLFFEGLDGPRLVFINGRYAPELSRVQDSPLCQITNLASVLDNDDKSTDLIGELAQLGEDGGDHPGDRRFVALNQSLLQDGVLIRTADNAVVEQPVYLVFVSIGGSHAVASHPRVVIDAAQNSELVVVEHYAGIGENQNLCNAVTEIRAARGSRVEHYRVQDESKKAFHLAAIHARVHTDATLTSHNICVGAALSRLDLHVDLAEPGAAVELNGLYLVSGHRHADNHTRVDHRAPHTRSIERYRGILNDSGRGVFNGKAIVHPDAQKIEAHQSNRNLLLSDGAEVDTKPELEIYADDVKCSHGATVGQLDEDSLFYIRSRGIGEHQARSLLTFAFAKSVVERITLQPVRRRLEKALADEFLDQTTSTELK